MPNHKTRKQKQLADQRRQAYAERTQTFSYTPAPIQPSTAAQNSLPTDLFPIAPATGEAIHTTGYHYLIHDLRKTLLVTVAIVVIQLLLHAFIIK